MDKTKILNAYNKWITTSHRLPSLKEINTPENRLPTEKDIADSLGLNLNEYLEIYHPIYYKYGRIPQESYNASYNKKVCELCHRYLMDKEHTGYIAATKDYKLPKNYGTWAVANFGMANTMATLAGINDCSFASKYFVTSKTHKWLRWVSRFCTARTFFVNSRINDTFNTLCGQVRNIFEKTGMFNFCDCKPKNDISFKGSILVLNPFEMPENNWELKNQLFFLFIIIRIKV